MRAVLQRVVRASVSVDGAVVGRIDAGALVLVGAGRDDTHADVDYIVKKISELRVFEDDRGKMNLSLLDVGGEALVVSQFTLYGDVRKGRRPSFARSLHPEQAREMIDRVSDGLRELGIRVETGQFGAMMDVSLVNAGPVTILLDSQKEF